jgi:hypothetical protein
MGVGELVDDRDNGAWEFAHEKNSRPVWRNVSAREDRSR